MVFVFGTMDKEHARGFVVDRCPSCLDLEWFQVLDHRQVWHAYFVPLGRGKLVYASRRCSACGAELPLEEGELTPITESERGALELFEGLARTNPSLAKRFAAIEALRATDKDAYREPDDEGSRRLLDEAVTRLSELERRGVDTARYLGRFTEWARLSPSERELLAAELRGFHAAATG